MCRQEPPCSQVFRAARLCEQVSVFFCVCVFCLFVCLFLMGSFKYVSVSFTQRVSDARGLLCVYEFFLFFFPSSLQPKRDKNYTGQKKKANNQAKASDNLYRGKELLHR